MWSDWSRLASDWDRPSSLGDQPASQILKLSPLSSSPLAFSIGNPCCHWLGDLWFDILERIIQETLFLKIKIIQDIHFKTSLKKTFEKGDHGQFPSLVKSCSWQLLRKRKKSKLERKRERASTCAESQLREASNASEAWIKGKNCEKEKAERKGHNCKIGFPSDNQVRRRKFENYNDMRENN